MTEHKDENKEVEIKLKIIEQRLEGLANKKKDKWGNIENWSKNHEGVLNLLDVALIPIVGIFATGILGWLVAHHEGQTQKSINDLDNRLERQLEDEKKLNLYLQNIGKIIETDGKLKLLNNRPMLSLKLEQIKTIDDLTRTYTRILSKESRKLLILHLYETGLINHTKAINFTPYGVEGMCNIDENNAANQIYQDIKEAEAVSDQEKVAKLQIELSKLQLSSSYCNLSTARFYLNYVDLSHLFLKQIKLHYSYLNNAKLMETNLSGAELIDTGLRNADLTKANLTKAFLNDAEFNEANLTEANITKANFEDANLTGAILTGVKITDVPEGKDDDNRALYNCKTIFPDGYKPTENLWRNKDISCP